MLYYDRIVISKEIDLATSSGSKEYMVCHYWFFNNGFKYKDYVCNGCHDLLMQCVNISKIVIATVKGADYCCIIYDISKSESINLFKNFVLDNR